MATIVERAGKDGNPRFMARVRVKGTSVTETFSTRSKAEQWARRMQSDLENQVASPAAINKKWTVAAIIDRHLEIVEREEEQKDLVNLRQRLAWWKKKIGNLHISTVKVGKVRELRAELLKETTCRGTKRSKSTANRYVYSLSAAITSAIEDGEFRIDNPCLGLAKLTEPEGRARFLAKEVEKRPTDNQDLQQAETEEIPEFARVAKACRESKTSDYFIYS